MVAEVLPAGLFQKLPNGDLSITRPHLEALTAHVVHARSMAAAEIADSNARERIANDQRDAANAEVQQADWKAKWVPVLAAVGGATFATVVIVVVEFVAGWVKR